MSEIFRDRTEGVAARRLDLLRRRRDELVTMPHAVRRVVVSRAAWTAAGLATLVCGVALIGAAAAPPVAALVSRGLPGMVPAPLQTLLCATWVCGLVAYAISRALAEHRFAVAMSHYVLPSDDPDHDVDRLSHERPDEQARTMAHRLEVRSAALPVAAAAIVLPATVLYVLQALRVGGWPATGEVEAMLAERGGSLIALAALGLAGAVAMTSRAARAPAMAVAAGIVATGALLGAAVGFARGATGVTWWLATAATVAATVALVVRRLRVERERIAAKDPAAGSELFTWRGLARGVRAVVVKAGSVVTTKRLAAVVGGLVLVTLFGAPVQRVGANVRPAHDVAEAPARATVTANRGTFSHAVQQPIDHGVAVDLYLDGADAIDVRALGGVDSVPAGWTARIVARSDVAPAGSLRFDPLALGATNARVVDNELTIQACDGHPEPLGVRVTSTRDSAVRYTVYFDVTLAPARCLRDYSPRY